MNETNEQARLVARKIIKRLSADIGDRRGLGDEWEQIDSKVMEDELVPAWTKIIAEEVAKASGQQPEAVPTAEAIAGSLQRPCSASPSRVRKMYDALKTITMYQTPARLRKDSERLYGLDGDEAMDIAYENIIEHARSAIHGMRKPK